MSEYKRVKYERVIGDQWRIVWPSGVKGFMIAESEEDLKSKIDSFL